MKLMTLLSIAFFLLCLLAVPATVRANEVITLWTGEYPPYTSEKFSEGGPIAQIVSRSLKMIALDSTIKYSAWSEIPSKLEVGSSISFPYIKNRERLTKFEFSDLVFSSQSKFFYYGDKPKSLIKDKKYWTGKTHCRPAAWDLDSTSLLFKDFHFKVERPVDLETCFRMLKEGKVDLVQMTDSVAWSTIRKEFKAIEGFRTLSDASITTEFFVIVSKSNPKARAILRSFNQGLQQLKVSGEYKRILEKGHAPASGVAQTHGRVYGSALASPRPHVAH